MVTTGSHETADLHNRTVHLLVGRSKAPGMKLDRIVLASGHPRLVGSDNGTELISIAVLKWLEDRFDEEH